MKKAFLIPFLFAAQVAFAQQAVKSTIGIAQQNLEDLGKTSNAGMVWSYDDRYEGIKGSAYFLKQWSEAKITLNNNTFETIHAKYNI